MKRSRILSTLAAATFAGLAFTACEKKPDASAPPPPNTDPVKPGTPAAPGTPTTPAKPVAGSPAAPAVAPVAPAPAADVAKIAANYGFVARLPKDVEGFTSVHRLHDLWDRFSNSKWAKTVLDHPMVKDNPDFSRAREQWSSPDGLKAREVAEAVLGQEISIAMPAGFTDKIKPWMELATTYFESLGPTLFLNGFSGRKMDPAEMQALLKSAAPQLIPVLAKCEAVPFMFAIKAGKIRPLVDEQVASLKQIIAGSLPMAELTTFKFADKYDFDSVSVTGQRLLVGPAVQNVELQLTEILGDKAKAEETLKVLLAKRFEIAWGWVDDYLILTVGTDHSHLKLAPNQGESALAIAEVGRRATQFAEKKPFGLSYTSKKFLDLFTGKIEFADYLKTGAESLGGILTKEQVDTIVADARRLEAKAQTLFTTVNDSAVQVDFWDAGLRTEFFGGPRMKGADASKPLTFGPLSTVSTLFFVNSRTNGAHSKATTDFVEEAISTVWGWYEKFGRTMVPESERQGAAMVEATALPMLKEFWKNSRLLGKAFGDESAFLIDTAGAVPAIAGIPPFLAEGKIPRLAWVMELKDRAALAEAWKGYYTLIKQLAALREVEGLPEPTMKKEGDVELHFIPLPMETGDLLPHVALSKDRWIFSSSPSLTKELVAKSGAPTGAPAAAQLTLNFTALYDFAAVWLKVADKNGSQFMQPPQFEEFTKNRPLIDSVLNLARSFQGVEWRLSEDSGQTHQSVHLKLQDAK